MAADGKQTSGDINQEFQYFLLALDDITDVKVNNDSNTQSTTEKSLKAIKNSKI